MDYLALLKKAYQITIKNYPRDNSWLLDLRQTVNSRIVTSTSDKTATKTIFHRSSVLAAAKRLPIVEHQVAIL